MRDAAKQQEENKLYVHYCEGRGKKRLFRTRAYTHARSHTHTHHLLQLFCVVLSCRLLTFDRMNEFLVCNTGAASVHAIVMMCTAVIPWWWRWRRFSVKVYPLLTPHRCTSNAAAPHCNCSYLRCNRKLQTKAKWNCNNTALEMNAQEKKSHDLLPIIKMYRDKLKTTTPRYLFISSLYIYMRLNSTLAHTHTLIACHYYSVQFRPYGLDLFTHIGTLVSRLLFLLVFSCRLCLHIWRA